MFLNLNTTLAFFSQGEALPLFFADNILFWILMVPLFSIFFIFFTSNLGNSFIYKFSLISTIISFLLRIVAPRRRIHALALVHARARIAVSDCCRYSMAQEEAATTESSVIGPLQMLDSCTTATQANGWGGIGKRQVHRCSSAANALRPVQAPSALGA